MELVAPAGNIDKLYYAYTYGADASYIGLKRFSLRIKADNFYEDEYKQVIALKEKYPNKKLFCALNISFHNHDIDQFMKNIDYFKLYPIDSFIVQDLGIVPVLQKYFPNAALHLSTQASCVNSGAVKMYQQMGFKRVVLGRETTLDEIRQIKDAVPEMELEAFAHGAMCIAYSGRCLMSAYLTGRSANSGYCSQSCRWNYDVLIDGKKITTATDAVSLAQSGALVLREHERSDQYFPVYEGDDFTAVLSSKDLRMIEHLDDMKKAGVDAIKVEGRMKSIYYVALVTRAYRKALDLLEGKITPQEAQPFINELDNVSHRESTTGFYYNRGDADKTTIGATDSPYELMAVVKKQADDATIAEIVTSGKKTLADRQKKLDAMHPMAREAAERDYTAHPEKVPPVITETNGWYMYELEALNKFDLNTELEFITPVDACKKAVKGSWTLVDPKDGTILPWVCNGHSCMLYTKETLPEGALIRVKDAGFIPGSIRDTGREKKQN